MQRRGDVQWIMGAGKTKLFHGFRRMAQSAMGIHKNWNQMGRSFQEFIGLRRRINDIIMKTM